MNSTIEQRKARIAQQFSRSATRYDDVACVQADIGFDAMQRLPKKLGHCLDVGCGTGKLTQRLAESATHVEGIDLSSGMIAQAKKYQRQDRIHFRVADAENLPFPEHHFDSVFSSMALQWCDPVDRALREIHRVLKPAGKAYLALLVDGSMDELRKAWQCVGEAFRVNQFATEKQVKDSALKAGFAVDVETCGYTTHHQDVIAALNSVRKVGASVLPRANQPQSLTRKKLDLLASHYQRLFAKDGLLPLTYQVCFLSLEITE